MDGADCKLPDQQESYLILSALVERLLTPSTPAPHPRLRGTLGSLRPLLMSVEESGLLPVSSRFFGGLRLDVKRKLPWFPSDFYDGFHIQSISAVLFIYLGCITNAITFGGLLGDATDNYQVSMNWGTDQ